MCKKQGKVETITNIKIYLTEGITSTIFFMEIGPFRVNQRSMTERRKRGKINLTMRSYLIIINLCELNG